MENRRIEVHWSCPACEVGGQDPLDDHTDHQRGPTCWNCGGPVVVDARPPVRLWTGPGAV
ncbi:MULTISPECIES: hypothetical protein [unclassified Blastococcus]